MIAEAELLGAANSIEAASRKLAQLQPRRQPKVSWWPRESSKFNVKKNLDFQ